MSHHTSTATSGGDHASPVWNSWDVARCWRTIGRLARWLWSILRAHRRPCILAAGAVLVLGTQVVLMCIAFYLVDLSIALMELWAQLARKHLELTLTAAGG